MNIHPNAYTALGVIALIGAFLFVQHDDHRGEWRESSEMQIVQQEEAARDSREFAGQAVCGPGALAQWDGDVLSCFPKRGKSYKVAGERHE